MEDVHARLFPVPMEPAARTGFCLSGRFTAGGIAVKRYLIAPLLVIMLLCGLFSPVAAAPPASVAAGNAVSWLRGQQQPNGGFPGMQDGSDPSATADAAVAFAAAGVDPAQVKRDGHSIIDFLSASAGTYGTTTRGREAHVGGGCGRRESPRVRRSQSDRPASGPSQSVERPLR